MPGLAHWFGVLPADVDEMTQGEVEVFLDALEDIARRQKG